MADDATTVGREQLLEARTVQLAELEAMEGIFCDDFEMLTPDRLAIVAAEVDSDGAGSSLDTLSDIELRCSFKLSAGTGQGAAAAEVHASLPSTYPVSEPPRVSVVNCTLPRAHTSALQHGIRIFVQEEFMPGCELLLQVAGHAQERLAEAHSTAAEEADAAAAATAASSLSATASLRVGRAVVWFHHIKSPKKKASIAAWSNELNVRGFAKPGYPGVLYAEGEKDDVDELLRRMRAQRWKAMAVRAEEWGDVPAGGALEDCVLYTAECGCSGSAGIEFLGETDMGEAAARFDAMGLGPLFKRAVLKMKPVGADEGGAGGGGDAHGSDSD